MDNHKPKYYFLFLFCAMCYFSLSLPAQTTNFSTSPEIVLDSLQAFDNYTVEDGLSNNTIYDILEDKYGYIWIGTAFGLSRFDGKSFKNYYHKPQDPTSISNNKIHSIIEDSNGDLWIGTDDGLNRFSRKNESFQRYYENKYKSDALPGNHVRAMLADTAGVIWLDTANGFLSRFDTQQETFENYSHEPPDIRYPYFTIKKRKNGNIVILGRRITPKEFNVQTKKFEEFPYLKNLKQYYYSSSFYESDNGELLINNSAKTSIVTNANVSTHKELPHLTSIYDVLEEKNDILWMGGYKSGAIHYDMSTNRITRYKNSSTRATSIVSDFILKIKKDKKGQIWFGTMGGLSKLKANQFIQHIKNDKGSNKITAIVPNEDTTQLWVATSNQGLFTYNLKTNQYEKHIARPEILSNTIMDLHLDTAGQLWMAHWAGRGYNILNTETDKIGVKKLCNNSYYDWWGDILETRDKKIYLSSWGMGPILVNRENNDLYSDYWRSSYTQGTNATPILIAGNKLYFSDGGKLHIKNPQSGSSIVNKKSHRADHACVYQYNPYINYSTSDANPQWTSRSVISNVRLLENDLWVATSKDGLFKVDTTELKANYSALNSFQDTIIDITASNNYYLLGPSSIKVVTQKIGLENKLILPFDIEASQNSSIKIVDQTIFITSPKYLQYYNLQRQEWKIIDFSQKAETIKATIKMEEEIWVATNSNIYKLNKNDSNLQEVKIPRNKFPINNITCLAIEDEDKLWLGTDNGLYFIDLVEDVVQPYFSFPKDTLSLPSDKIKSLHFENNKDLWIGTNKGIAKYNRNIQNFIRYNKNSKDGLSSNLSTSLYEDSSKKIWVGNSGGTLDRVDVQNGLFTHFFKEPWNPKSLKPDNDDIIHCIYEDKKGRIWIGGGSLSLFDEDLQNFTHYNDQSDNPFNSVRSIIEDEQGNLWLGTNRGLYSFDYDTENFQHYGQRDNIQGLEYSKASCKLPDGRIVMGGDNGFNIIQTNKITTSCRNPTITLYNFNASDYLYKEKLIANEEINLSNNQNTISLSVSLGSYQEENIYRYKLSDYQKEWTTQSNIGQAIQFENLPPGAYILQVNAGNVFEGWLEDTMKINLHIAEPFWNTWWFFACTFIPFALLTILFARRQQKRIIDKKDKDFQLQFLKIKASLANMNPHFVFNVLGSIQNQVLEGEKQAASNSIVKLSKLIRRFLDSTATMTLPSLANDFTRIDEIPLNEEIDLINMYIEFEQLQHDGRFHYLLNIEEGLETSNYSIPPMLIQPFVENAIKHGLLPKRTIGTLNISLKKLGEEGIEIIIVDDGVGIKKSKEIKRYTKKTHNAKGLSLLNDRVSLLNQIGYNINIQTTSKEIGGTLINLKLNRN